MTSVDAKNDPDPIIEFIVAYMPQFAWPGFQTVTFIALQIAELL